MIADFTRRPMTSHSPFVRAEVKNFRHRNFLLAAWASVKNTAYLEALAQLLAKQSALAPSVPAVVTAHRCAAKEEKKQTLTEKIGKFTGTGFHKNN